MNLAGQVSESKKNMIIYEGIVLIAIVVTGSLFLIGYVWQDYKRNQRLQLFFSIFTHDIKTSISRLRLQAEILEEELPQETHSSLSRLIQDVTRLDLQLENSLMFTHINKPQFYIEKVKLSQLVATTRADFAQLNIELKQDVEFSTDKKWFLSILKNIFQNSVLHGQATRIEISAQSQSGSDSVEITIADNGSGPNVSLTELGSPIYKSKNKNSNGIGLYLSKVLMQKLNGDLRFSSPGTGFNTHLTLKGNIL